MNNNALRGKNSYHDDKMFWPYHAERGQKILRDEIPAPSLIEIDPTDEGCNQGCIHCCFGSSQSRKLITIDVKLLLEFLSQAYEQGTYAYELVGGGEPTAHPEIASIITGIAAMAKPAHERPRIGMVTNGVLLNRIFPVAHHLDFIRVSLDTSDPDIYNVLHGVPSSANHFGRVLANVRTLVSMLGEKHVRLGYLVVPPHNHHEEDIARFAELAHQLGVGHVAFRPAFLDHKTEKTHWKEAADAIVRERSKYHPGFILGGVGGSWDNALGKYKHPVGPCRTRPLVLVIKASGEIPSCFLYRERLAERPAIGHISAGFSRVWFSEQHKKSIAAVERKHCPDVCKLYRSERALEKIEKIMASNSPVPVLDEAQLDDPYFI